MNAVNRPCVGALPAHIRNTLSALLRFTVLLGLLQFARHYVMPLMWGAISGEPPPVEAASHASTSWDHDEF